MKLTGFGQAGTSDSGSYSTVPSTLIGIRLASPITMPVLPTGMLSPVPSELLLTAVSGVTVSMPSRPA